MMAETETEQTGFFQALEELYNSGDKTAALERFKVRGWERFIELGLPTRQDDLFRYIPLRHLYSQRYGAPDMGTVDLEALAAHVFPECRQSVIVMLNGTFRPELSNIAALPAKMIVAPFSTALQSYSTLLNNLWSKGIKDERDPFAALNRALHGEGAFLYLPPRTQCAVPLQIVYASTQDEGPSLIAPRVQLFIGNHSALKLVSSHVALANGAPLLNLLTEFSLEEGSSVDYIQSNCHASRKLWHFDAVRATLKRDSTLKIVAATTGSQTVRNDYHIQLQGENSEVRLSGIWMLSGKAEAHQQIYIDHQAPHCRSMQLFKGALDQLSHSSFEGKIMVRQAAQKTQAFQLNNNLLLSSGSRAESKPNLEIFADDVKASHGATVGQLDKEALFYMQARGFSPETAKSMLVYSFCKEVIDMVTIPSLRDALSSHAHHFVTGA
jgi:Fe-S cluster assembly protein SufD